MLIDGILQPGVSIRETIVHKPIYFGQKDLSSTGEGFEKDLVDKLLGSKLDHIRSSIDAQKAKVGEAVDRLLKVEGVRDQIKEQEEVKQDTEHQLKFYADHGIEAKLQKRLDFDRDIRTMKKGVEITDGLISDLKEVLAKHEDDIRNFTGYTSKHNPDLFDQFYKGYTDVVKVIDTLKTTVSSLLTSKTTLTGKQSELA